jgi:ankyrin repeat protein
VNDREQRRAGYEAFLRIDGAFKAGDLLALRAAVGDPEGFPNVRAPHDAIGCSLLQYAIYHSPLNFIKELLDLGADANYDDHDGFPSIMAALSCKPGYGSAGRSDINEIVEMLLDAGADPNMRGINDYTPLHYCAAEGNTELVELLLSRGADPSLRTRIDDLETPADVAEVAGHSVLAQRLRSAEPL